MSDLKGCYCTKIIDEAKDTWILSKLHLALYNIYLPSTISLLHM